MRMCTVRRLFVFVPLFAFVLIVDAAAQGSQAPPSGSGGTAPDPHPYRGSDNIIASSNAQTKTVTLNIIGAQGNANSGFNFNGFANGSMIIKVPEAWKVTVNYRVEASLYHSAIVVPWSERQAGSFKRAFPGSAMPHYLSGINKNHAAVHFSFTADKAGRYALVCAIPGHDIIGMWDQFDVVEGLAKPEVLVK